MTRLEQIADAIKHHEAEVCAWLAFVGQYQALTAHRDYVATAYEALKGCATGGSTETASYRLRSAKTAFAVAARSDAQRFGSFEPVREMIEELIRRLDACATVTAMVPRIEAAKEQSRKACTLMHTACTGAVVDDVTAYLTELARDFYEQAAARFTGAHTHGTAVQLRGDNRDVEIATRIAQGEELLTAAGKIMEKACKHYRSVGGTVEE